MPSIFRYLFIPLFALLPILAAAQGAGKLYGKQIYLPAEASAKAKESAEALQACLGTVTGAEFAMVNTPGAQGIFLVRDNSPLLPQVDLKALRAQESPEAFLLTADANRLWIVGKSDLALDRGVFWYLEKLGCRWLLPNERWTVIPKRTDITLKLTTVQAPAFFNRDFFGSGGFGRPAIDPKQRLADTWARYKRQNLFGGAMSIRGHAGEAFMLANKAELLAHPEYLAEINGKRQEWNIITKPCYSNPGLQALYVQDRLKIFRQTLQRTPDEIAVSVEPSDGGGHCECAACHKLGTVSDRVYTLVNLVAKAVAQEFPGKYVSLFAYWEHAAPPAIPIEKNVIVVLVPYGLQRTGMEPDELIAAWGKQHDFLGMYPYWSIADWSNCLPDFDYRTVPTLVRAWQASHTRLILVQGNFCGGSMSLPYFMASRLFWNPAQDEKAIADDYFTTAFGAARLPMRRMMERWADGFMLTDHEVALSYRDLKDAFSLSKDPAIRARLTDMGRYLHFLRLWYEYTSAPAGEEHVARGRDVLEYIWRIYDSNMVQTFRMAQQIGYWYDKGKLDDMLPENPRWAELPQLTDDEIGKLLSDGLKKYTPLDFTPRRFSDKLVPLQPVTAPNEQYVTTNTFSGSSEFRLAVGNETTSVRLKLKINLNAGKSDRLRLTDPADRIVYEEHFPANGEWQDVILPTAIPGNYTLRIIDQKNFYTLQIPSNLPFVVSGAYTSIALAPRSYFYVPKGQTKVAVYSIAPIPLKIFDPDGKPVIVERNEQKQKLFVIDVPAGMDGKVWSLANFKGYDSLRLLTVPSLFAYSPDGVMAPEETRPTPAVKN